MKNVELPSGMTLKDLLREKQEDSGESSGLSIEMGPIQEALEDHSFPLDESPVSRVRLINALMGRFGKGFKNHPLAKKALEHYDKEASMLKVIKHNRRQFHGQ